jgi:predicted ATPase
MNIKSIRLQNFRGFKDAKIELKPLTVLLGPNSAGKSSFGHALAAMAHAHKIYAAGAPGPVSLTPSAEYAYTWPVDLGKTNDLRTVGVKKGPVCIGLKMASGDLLELGFGGLQDDPNLIISSILHPIAEHDTLAGTSSPTVVSSEKSASTVFSARPEIVPPPDAAGSFIPSPAISAPIKLNRIDETTWRGDKKEWKVVLKGLSVLGVENVTGGRILGGVARDSLTSLLENLTYLRATRERPSRGYRDELERPQPIGYSGEKTPSILFRVGNEPLPVAYVEPPVVPNTIEEAQKSDSKWKERKETLRDALNHWLVRLDVAADIEIIQSSVDEKLQMRVTPKGQSSHDITEIGFGVSQVIPVLVAGLLQPKDSLFIVDLPEAHLHPRPQGAIADFFCSLALTGRSCLVETHSEMFFHQLRLRAAMDPRLMENIAVYFIDQPKDGLCSKPRLVDLGYEGELAWPDGFLREAWETETPIYAVREAKRLASG